MNDLTKGHLEIVYNMVESYATENARKIRNQHPLLTLSELVKSLRHVQEVALNPEKHHPTVDVIDIDDLLYFCQICATKWKHLYWTDLSCRVLRRIS